MSKKELLRLTFKKLITFIKYKYVVITVKYYWRNRAILWRQIDKNLDKNEWLEYITKIWYILMALSFLRLFQISNYKITIRIALRNHFWPCFSVCDVAFGDIKEKGKCWQTCLVLGLNRKPLFSDFSSFCIKGKRNIHTRLSHVDIIILSKQETTFWYYIIMDNCMVLTGFIVYASFVFVLAGILIYYYQPLYGRTHLIIYVGICSLMGSLTVCLLFIFYFLFILH